MSKHIYVITVFLAIQSLGSGYAQTCNNNLPATTPTDRFIDHGNATISDTWTNLMWKQCSEGMTSDGASGCVDSALTFNWQSALQRVSVVNSGSSLLNLGYTNWRLPNIKELESIVERQCEDPAINLTIFPQATSGFWSSTAYAAPAGGAWQLYFFYGSVGTTGQSANLNIRLVRDL